MAFFGFLPLIGKIVDKVADIIDKSVEDKDLANRLKVAIKEKILVQDHEEIMSLIESQTKVILAEAQGQSWLQRNWRPLLMVTFNFIVAWNFIIAPIFSLKVVPVPDQMWQLLKIGIGGYIFGRSGEKIAQVLQKK